MAVSSQLKYSLFTGTMSNKCPRGDQRPKPSPLEEQGEYILPTYTTAQADQPLREEDTIRAQTGILYTEEEIQQFRDKSNARCPTYGSCPHCFAAGPVGEVCTDCTAGDNYKVVFAYPYDNRSYHRRIVDSETLASALNRPSHPALANRKFNWISTPLTYLTSRKLQRLINQEEHRLAQAIFDLPGRNREENGPG